MLISYGGISSDITEKIKNITHNVIETKIIMNKSNDTIIYENCKHNFITDIIDIDPEKEKTICYCTICELNKEWNKFFKLLWQYIF